MKHVKNTKRIIAGAALMAAVFISQTAMAGYWVPTW